jgi:hypothetical protein
VFGKVDTFWTYQKAACPPNGGQADIIKHYKKKLMSDSKILGDDSFTSKEVDQTVGKHIGVNVLKQQKSTMHTQF